uniref:(California timema) hypothetical protein n=1 Tax=Timema californicum TaxID=61474 RepID=A0A7R9J159_TIMCA|nr:unnamed protein product [Timema californicum]
MTLLDAIEDDPYLPSTSIPTTRLDDQATTSETSAGTSNEEIVLAKRPRQISLFSVTLPLDAISLIMEFFDMIPIPMLDGVVMHAPFRNTVDGTLCISSHHLILSSRKEGVEELWMLHRNIDLVERRPNGLSGGSIVIKCKDFRVIQLDINSPEEFVQVAACIENLASIEDVRLFYPFFYRHMSPILEDGWTAFTPETEYAHLVNSLADEWKISYVNKDFGVSTSIY